MTTSTTESSTTAPTHITIGTGKAVHVAYGPSGHRALCGSGGRRRGAPTSGRITKAAVTCSKCLAAVPS